jgi:hypothetical protein
MQAKVITILAAAGLIATAVFGYEWWRARRELAALRQNRLERDKVQVADHPSAPTPGADSRDEAKRWRAEALRLKALYEAGGSDTNPSASPASTGAVAAVPGDSATINLPRDTQARLLEAFMVTDFAQRLKELKRLGIMPTGEDFRRAATKLGTDWNAINQLNQMLPAWVEIDPRGAATFVEGLADANKRNQALSVVASNWARKDPAAVLDWIQRLAPGALRDQVVMNYVSATASAKPREAAEWSLKIEADNFKVNAVRQTASEWARQDPDAALRWIETLPAGPLHDQAIQAAIYQLAQKNPAKAMEWLDRIKDENMRMSTTPSVVSQWARQDAAAASVWLQTLPAGRWRDTTVQQFVYQLAQTQAVVAVEWAQSIGDENIRNSATAFAVGQWGSQDPAATAEWLQNQQAGRARDNAVQQFVFHILAAQPAVAVDWAASIGDESLRISTLTSAAANWLQKDRQAASQWLRTAPLPESTRQSLLNMPSGTKSIQWSGGAFHQFYPGGISYSP